MKRRIALLLLFCMLASLAPTAVSEDEISILDNDTPTTVPDGADSNLPDLLGPPAGGEAGTADDFLDLQSPEIPGLLGVDLPNLQQEQNADVAQPDFLLHVNESYTLDTAALADRMEVPEDQVIAFSSSDPTIADVTSDGTIVALATGDALINCLVGDVSIAVYTVKVIEAFDATPVAGPADETPAEETPADGTPADETPADETPADETPASEAPSDGTPTGETPSDETPTDETPTDETPGAEAPAGDTSTEEPPAEDTYLGDIPVEKAPAEAAGETYTEEFSVEKAPADAAEETPTDQSTDKPEKTSVADDPQPTDTQAQLVPEETEEMEDASKTEASQGKVPSKLELGVKEKYTLDTKSLAKGGKITYKTSKKAVATVSNTGVITGVKAGTATVTCMRGKTKVATCTVKVVKAPTKVTLELKTVTLGVKESLTLTPTLPKGTHASFTWSVKNKKIATVSKDGVVKGVKAGSTTVTVKTHNGQKATVTVKVVKAPTKVTLEPKTVALNVKETLTLTPTLPKGTHASFTWSSKNKKIATVSKDGVVKGIKVGTTTVTVKTHNGQKATVTVNVIKLNNQAMKDAAAALGISVTELAELAGVDLKTLNGMSADEIKALEFTTDNVVWKLNDGNTGVVIAKYKGTKSSLTIDDKYYKLPVTEIGEGAFEGNEKLKEINLPSTVTVIGKRAFKNCVNLSKMQ